MPTKFSFAFIASLMFIAFPLHFTSLNSSQLFAAGPKVIEISTDDVHELLDRQKSAEAEAKRAGRQAPQADFVLVDVRSEAEMNIAIIPGAITKDEFEANRAKYADRTVIPYCAVGGRCSAYAAKLADQGLHVKNYKGSMLDWVICELPLVTPDGKPTDRVFAFGPNHKVPGKYKQVRK